MVGWTCRELSRDAKVFRGPVRLAVLSNFELCNEGDQPKPDLMEKGV